MTNDITIISCPQCGFPKIRDCGNGLYQCDDCGTHFDKNENIVQTNEEWLRSCTTEELAKYLQSISVLSLESKDEDLEDWKRWLKEKHE